MYCVNKLIAPYNLETICRKAYLKKATTSSTLELKSYVQDIHWKAVGNNETFKKFEIETFEEPNVCKKIEHL